MAAKENAVAKEVTKVEKPAEAEIAAIRTSKIRKCIVRKLNTAKYETIDIIVDHEHEVTWKNVTEFMAKSENVSKLVLKDYEDTEIQVLKELNLNGYKAFPGDAESLKKPLEKVEMTKDFDRLK
jgi:hypothetical protein